MKKILPCLFLTGLLFTACNAKSTDSTKPSDKLLDNNIFSDATTSGNLARCKDILDSTLKASCSQVINDRNATNAAITALDKNMCGKVSDARYKQDCETQIDAKVEAKNSDTKRLSTEQTAIEKGDASICDQMKQENDKYTCQFNILNKLASQKNDPSLCDKIGRKDLVSDCKTNVTKK